MDVVERGAGPTLLFLHGTAPPESLYGLAELLSDSYHTVVPSLPGYGASPPTPNRTPADVVDMLVALIDERDLDQISLVGHSGGAYLALAVACRIPERIDRTALLAPAHHFDEQLRAELPQFAEAARAGELGYETVAPLWFSETFATDHPEAVGAFAAPYERDIDGMADDLDRYRHADDLRPQMRELDVPVYVRSGTDDVRIPPESVDPLEGLLSDVEIDLVDGAGHMVHVEDAPGTTWALRGFFDDGS